MEIKDAALRYLEHRMRTEKEMRTRLREKEFAEDEIDDTVSWLKQMGYISDHSYAAEYLRFGFEKGRGIARIRAELREKGLSDEDIQKGIYDYEDEYEIDIMEAEFERALAQAQKTAGTGAFDEKAEAKLGRRLHSLGYGSSVIYKVIGRIKETARQESCDS